MLYLSTMVNEQFLYAVDCQWNINQIYTINTSKKTQHVLPLLIVSIRCIEILIKWVIYIRSSIAPSNWKQLIQKYRHTENCNNSEINLKEMYLTSYLSGAGNGSKKRSSTSSVLAKPTNVLESHTFLTFSYFLSI